MKLFAISTLSIIMTMSTVFIQVASSSPLLENHHQRLEIVKRQKTPQPCNECKKGLVCAEQPVDYDSFTGYELYITECRVPMGANCQKDVKCADGFYCGPSGKCDGHKGTPLNSACQLQSCDHGLYCDHSKVCKKMG